MSPSPLHPPPERTPLFGANGQLTEPWRRFFLAVQASVNTVVTTLITNDSSSLAGVGMLGIDSGDGGDEWSQPGPPGVIGATGATGAMGAMGAGGPPGPPGDDGEGSEAVFGGIPSSFQPNLAQAIGVLPATNGGTGQAVYAVGDLLTASTTTALSRLADVAVGAYLRSGGVSTTPLWSTLTLPNAATTGDLLAATSTNAVGSVADVAVGQVLTSGGVGVAPAYSATLPSAVQGNITAVGTIATGVWNGTAIPAANGGTGQSVYAVGDLLYASTTSALSRLAAIAAGSVLLAQGAGTAPIWGQVFTTYGTALTGNINNYVLSSNSSCVLITLTGGAPVVSGIATGAIGQIVIFKNTGTGLATFVHNSGASSAGNRLFNIITSAPTPVAAGGFIAYQYDGTQWQCIGHTQGKAIAWTPVDGSGAGLVFTIATASYIVTGKAIFITCEVSYPANVSAAATTITGLPFNDDGGSYGGAISYTNFGSANITVLELNSLINFYTPINGTQILNSSVSGIQLRFTFPYFTS